MRHKLLHLLYVNSIFSYNDHSYTRRIFVELFTTTEAKGYTGFTIVTH